MRTPLTLAAYALGLVVIFGAAAGAGRVIGPDETPAPATAHPATTTTAGPPGGLQVVQDGYRLVPVTTRLAVGIAQPFTFRVLGPDSRPVTAYTTKHERDLHLIVVRRDLAGFQHLHPTLGADGTWSVPLAVAAPGQYRVFADLQPAGHATGLVLGVDVPAPGDYEPRALPAPATTAQVDGYTVGLTGDLAGGTLAFAVSRNGTPVTDLEPYLGAPGHLVVLREGDLAYLHAHPEENAAVFHAEVPSAGAYRLYLEFQHGGKVHTAEFTATTAGVTVPPDPAGHDADGHTHE